MYKRQFLDRKDPEALANRIWQELEVVTPSTSFPVRRMSGGNIWSTVMDSSYVEGAGKYDDYTGSYSLMSGTSMATVSYTHLDVYKRQIPHLR